MARKTGVNRDENGRFLPGGMPGPGRPRKTRSDSERSDGFLNAVTGLGHIAYDKRQSSRFIAERLDDETAADLWEANPLAGRIVETWPNEMLREGYDVVVSDRGSREKALEISERIEERTEELEFLEELWQGLAYARAYGGGAVLVGANDNKVLSSPLSVERVRSLDWFHAFEPRDIVPRYYYTDPKAPKFGKPSHFEIVTHTQGFAQKHTKTTNHLLVHESRLILFQGIKVSRRQRGPHAYFGGSVLTRVNRVLRDHDIGYDAAAILMHDFAQAVYKMQGMAEASAQDMDDELKTRFKAIQEAQSTLRMTVIDGADEYGRQQTPVTGLPELLDRFSTQLAAAADMPLTLLMGQSPGGMNATGDSDIRFFYDRVKGQQTKVLKPILKWLVSLVFRDLSIPEPEKWVIAFRPLWQESAKEQAETRYIQAKTDEIEIQNQVVTPEDIRLSRHGGDQWSAETSVNLEDAKELEEEVRESARLAARQSILSAEAAAGKSTSSESEPEAE